MSGPVHNLFPKKGTYNKTLRRPAEGLREDRRAMDRLAGPSVVVIGGGTGLSTLLKGLKEHTDNITAVVTVADDGGGSGMLRDDVGMLPPGDIRNCILALANTEPAMKEILSHRFRDGSLAGQSFGNLFLAALNEIYGSFDEAVKRMSDVLAVTGRVLPVTTADIRLRAVFEDGSEVLGESRIFRHKKEHDCRIRQVSLVPERPKALPEVLEAVSAADLIVLGPGSLYTSIIPNLMVDGVSEAVCHSRAVRLYVCNIMTQEGETEGYTAWDHVQELRKHACRELFELCLVHAGDIPDELQRLYAAERAAQVRVSDEDFRRGGVRLYRADLAQRENGHVRHDPAKLAGTVLEIYRANAGK